MAELTVMLVNVLGGVAVAVTVKPNASSGASSPLCRDTSQCLLPHRFTSSVLFLPSPRLSLSVSLSISPVFLVSTVSVVSLSTLSISLSRFPSLFSPVFLFFSFRVTIYRGKGSGVDPAPSHRCPCMRRTSPALSRRRQRWPMEASLAGHDCFGISS